MATFSVPLVTSNPSSWGPPEIDEANPNSAPGNVGKFATLPYAPFGRSDRLGRAADFTSSGGGGHRGGGGSYPDGKQRGGSGNFRRDGYASNRRFDGGTGERENAEDAFQLVDTTKAATTKRFVNPASKRRQHSQRLRQINARRAQSSGGGGAASAAGGMSGLDKMTRGGGGGRGAGGRGFGGRGGGGGRFGGGGWSNRVDRQPSVAVKTDWVQVDEIDLGKVVKNLVASSNLVPTPDDILWCGFLDPYNDLYDKVTARQPVPLKRMEHKEFYPVTTTDDPVLEKLAIDGAGQVFITDTSTFASFFLGVTCCVVYQRIILLLNTFTYSVAVRFIANDSLVSSHDLHSIGLSLGYCGSETAQWYSLF